MRIVVVVNSKSGRGRAGIAAGGIAAALVQRGHDVRTIGLGDDRRGALTEAEACVAVGGDGTLHALIDDCLATRTPVYHAPAGTENLFAREFGMCAEPAAVVEAVERGRRRMIDVGRAGSRAFVIMGSIGFDAGVIHRLDAVRKGAISHRSYVRPIIELLFRFHSPRISIEADGASVVQGRHGLVVIANSRQYAMRMDPARRAAPDDGLLDVVFLPHRSRVGLARWLILALGGAHVSEDGIVQCRAAQVEVRAEGEGAVMQLDGEAAALERSFRVEHRVLGVIVPVEV